MRNSKFVTIQDGENEVKFKLTQLSALSLQSWIIRAGIALAESGLLDLEQDEIAGGGVGLDQVINAITSKGFSFLGHLDPDKAENLLMDIVCKTAVKVSGSASVNLTRGELDATFSTIQGLISLEKEVFAVNFDFFHGAAASDTRISDQTESITSSRGISVKRSPR